jgi:glucokinase
MAKHGSIGIDIGGTKTLFVLFDGDFRPLKEIKVKTKVDEGEKNFSKTLEDSVAELLKKADRTEFLVSAVGIGCSGRVDPRSETVNESPNIPFLRGYPLKAKIAKLTGARTHIMNDCQAGLYGEHQLGVAVGLKNVIGVFMGTGLGGAVLIDAKVYTGTSGCAGDIGHYLLSPVGPLAGSDRHGILDDIVSRTAVAAEAATLAAKQAAPHLAKHAGTDVRNICSSDLAESIQKGDKAVEDLVRSRAKITGIAMSNLVDFLNPEMVVLGGGMVEAMGSIIKSELEEGIRAHITDGASKGLKVSITKLKHLAVATGAAKMAFDLLAATPELPVPARQTRSLRLQKPRILGLKTVAK